jgi:hypothetical protein
MKLVEFAPSEKADKKYKAVVEDGESKKTIHFGAKGMSDYTKHHDEERKKRYEDRHRAREDWSDPKTAGFWSKWILWNKLSVGASLADTKKRFGL